MLRLGCECSSQDDELEDECDCAMDEAKDLEGSDKKQASRQGCIPPSPMSDMCLESGWLLRDLPMIERRQRLQDRHCRKVVHVWISMECDTQINTYSRQIAPGLAARS